MVDFTFPSSEVKIHVKKVSPLLITRLQQKYPVPSAPIVKVELNGRWIEEPNEADPAYQITLMDHQMKLENKIRRILIRQGVAYTLTAEDTELVNKVRQDWRDTEDEELDGDNLEVFISYVAIVSTQDFEAFSNAVMELSQPTPKSDSGSDQPV